MTPTDGTKKTKKPAAPRRPSGATPPGGPVQTCPSCGTENPADSRFCRKCATSLQGAGGGTVLGSRTVRVPTVELARGNRLAGRYEIIEELGQGGMGKVFKVYDHKLSEVVALKLIRSEIGVQEKAIERFKNELKFTRKIAHRNICRMYDMGDVDFIHYITMEYVAGEDLKRFIKRAGPLNSGKAVAIAKQVCDGLAEAHRVGAVHRDLKSQNIMIDHEGNAKIMDFGIARFTDMDRMTGSGVMIGTPEYMSPEQVDMTEVDPRADLYSLGVVMYEMASGRVPFEGETALSLAMKHKTEKPKDVRELNAQVPAGLARVIGKCLEKDRDKRYQSAGELRTALEEVEQEFATAERDAPRPAAPARTKEPKARGKKIPPAVLAVGAVAVLAVVAVIVFLKPGAGPAPGPAAKPGEAAAKSEPGGTTQTAAPENPPPAVKVETAKPVEKPRTEKPAPAVLEPSATEAQVVLARSRLVDPKARLLKKGIDATSLFFRTAEAREQEARKYADQKKYADSRCLLTVVEKLYRICLDESKDAGRLRALSRYANTLRNDARTAAKGVPAREALFAGAEALLAKAETARDKDDGENALKDFVQAAFEFERIRWAGQTSK